MEMSSAVLPTTMLAVSPAFEPVAISAGLSVVLMCGVLSPLVVVKRLGFVGQGVSHSAFGGIGVAAMLAVFLPAGLGAGSASLIQLGVVVAFCIAAALGMAAVSHRRGSGGVTEDTAIGLFLVASMALGAVLVQGAMGLAASRGRAGTVQSWESILFGSILTADSTDAAAGWVVCAMVVGAAWWVRRPMMLWAFDEDSASAFGVSGRAMKTLLMVLLALAVVVAMRLAGVVLATALLVLPGATALKISDRLAMVTGVSVGCGVVGLLGGLTLSHFTDWQPGPCVVLVMTGIFAGAMVWGIRPRQSAEVR